MNVSCSGEPVFAAVCTFACPEGWTLNGSAALTCSATGHWSGRLPVCEGEAPMGVVVGALERDRGAIRLKGWAIHHIQTRSTGAQVNK